MRSNEVRTIFSVYQIWLQEGLTGTATDRHGVSDVVQTVERRMEPLRQTKPHREVSPVVISSHQAW